MKRTTTREAEQGGDERNEGIFEAGIERNDDGKEMKRDTKNTKKFSEIRPLCYFLRKTMSVPLVRVVRRKYKTEN